MTLILSVARDRAVVQVSDRLVSKVSGQWSGLMPHDENANKQVLVSTYDGVVCLGFSGLAYVGEVPTDEVIATAVVSRPEPGIGPMYLALRRIGDVLGSLSDADMRGEGIAVSGVGLRVRKRRVEPVMFQIERGPGSGPGVTFRRHDWTPFPWHKCALLHAIGTYDPSILVKLSDALDPRAEGVIDCRGLMIASVREAARLVEGVGDECLAVSIALDDEQRPDIALHFSPVRNLSVEILEGRVRLRSAYTPWILTDGIQAPPSTTTAGGTTTIGTLTYRVTTDAPPTDGAGEPLFHLGSQKPKAPPR